MVEVVKKNGTDAHATTKENNEEEEPEDVANGDSADEEENEEEEGEEGEEEEEGEGVEEEAGQDEEGEEEELDGVQSKQEGNSGKCHGAKVVAIDASLQPIKRPQKPMDVDGPTLSQQKRIGHAWETGPRIDVLHYKYVQEDYTRRQAAVDQLRERMQKKSRPGYELRVQRKWTCKTVVSMLARRHLSWMPCVVATMADAAWDGDILLIHSLLLMRGDVNARDKTGQLVLNIGIQQQHEPIVRLLLDRGADFDMQDDDTLMTPMNNSIIMGNKALTRRLLKRGVDVNLADGEGMTPLIWASVRGYLEVVAQLVECGANVNHQDCLGWTALHIACFKGYVDLLEFLLVNAKAKWDLEDVNGFTPFMFARIAGNHDIVKKLDEFIANSGKKRRWGKPKGTKKMRKKKPMDLTKISPKKLLAGSAN